MVTTLHVERIDILEGPGLDTLLDGLHYAVKRSGQYGEARNVAFRKVMFFGTVNDGTDVRELPGGGLERFFNAKVVGIRYMGNTVNSETRDDFVVTFRSSWDTLVLGLPNNTYDSCIRRGSSGIFEGYYNVHSRKGSLHLLK